MNIINEALQVSSRNSNFFELNLEFIKKNRYGVKVELDSFGIKQLQYISDKLNCKNGYMIYWLYKKGDDFSLKTYTVHELYMNSVEKYASGANIIIDFIGNDVYLYQSEIDFYLIFGQRDKLQLIDDYEYSDEKTLKILNDLNKTSGSDYYQWLYDTYQKL